MSSYNGAFVWHELMTTDTDAAALFYGSVLGWEAQDAGMPGMSYSRLMVGTTPAAGLMALPADASSAGARPHWTGYIAVENVDTAAGRVQQAGGAIHRPAADIPGVGRFAVVADPQGATFAIFQGNPSDAEPARLASGTPGSSGWNELHAADWQPAFAFYAGLFGWQKGNAVDMGPMGTYQLFTRGADAIGGMMTKSDVVPAPFWLYYFIVDRVDAAVSRVTDAGGRVLNGPHEVPGGSWIVQCLDPQGAMFALVGPAR